MKTDNEIIADFMGVKIGVDKYSWHPGSFDPIKVENLAYDTTWGWIMPVVEKIESLEYNVIIFNDEDGNQCMVTKKFTHYPKTQEDLIISNVPVPRTVNKMEAIYKTVVQFIKWHNETLALKTK